MVDDASIYLKPILNWANICFVEYGLRCLSNFTSFLNWAHSSLNMVWTVRRTFCSEMAYNYNEMQASAQTCGRSAALKQHDPKCKRKSWSQCTLINPHRVIQLTTIDGSQRQGCVSHKSTNKQIPSKSNSKASELPSDTVVLFFLFSSSSTGWLSAN